MYIKIDAIWFTYLRALSHFVKYKINNAREKFEQNANHKYQII